MLSLDATVALDDGDLDALAEIRKGIEAKMSRLRELDPCILDMSFREATLSSRYGHTLADKIELYELARDFGFTDFGLPNFYDFPSVTDDRDRPVPECDRTVPRTFPRGAPAGGRRTDPRRPADTVRRVHAAVPTAGGDVFRSSATCRSRSDSSARIS